MRRTALVVAMLITPSLAKSDDVDPVIEGIINEHILPRFAALAGETQALEDAARADCSPASEGLRGAYGAAFDAWISASHLRFGPTEIDDRAFALAFWPDSRGATPRALNGLIADQDPIAQTPEDYASVSIAARGFYAMEFLLFDEALMTAGDPGYHCMLIQTMSADMNTTSQNILNDWQSDYAAEMLQPGPSGIYRSDEEVLQEAFKALTTGLQFTSETRLGRPLGTFDRPRPTRAEARRSGRSAHHVTLSLNALRDLASHLAQNDAELTASLDAGFESTLSQLSSLNDPVFEGVSEPQTRIKVEVLQQSVENIRTMVQTELGPTLGVAAGFNSLDGD